MLRPIRVAFDLLRTVFALSVVVVLTVILGLFAIVVASISPNSWLIRPTMRLWAFCFIKASGVTWQVKGMEHLEKGRSYVLVGNHLSNLDPPFHIAVFSERVSVRFLAKAELFRIPIFAQAMRRVGIIETDRAAGPTAHRKINEQVSLAIERGQSLVIYPEGTRSRDASEVKLFKKGAFRIAIDNGLPVVPVATAGLDEAWPPDKKLIRGGRVRMVVHEPIDTTGMGPADIDGLRDRAYAAVSDTYSRIRG